MKGEVKISKHRQNEQHKMKQILVQQYASIRILDKTQLIN